jgi:transcriptional regulator with XRE-family HTH domain
VSDIERGVRPVLAVATLEKLAQALGVTMADLLTASSQRRLARWEEARRQRPGG